MNNHIVIKGKKDRLEINLNSDIDFLTLSEFLATKISEARGFIGKSKLAIEFVGRVLTSEEENQLIKVITENSDIIIAYVFSEKMANTNEFDIELPKTLTEEGKTYFHKGTLRSGAKIESDGNVIVIGDVNPGAIIRAKGNIIVIGHLNGTVYGGLGGDVKAFIGAMSFNPIQLTIGINTISDLQKEILDSNRVKKGDKFKFAHIKNQEIVIEEWI